MTEDEALEMASRHIRCPVPWCEGLWLDHGGDGHPPEHWIHLSNLGFRLPHGATLDRDQEGAGPVTWVLRIDTESTAFLDTDLLAIAAHLREIAAAIADVAALCEADGAPATSL